MNIYILLILSLLSFETSSRGSKRPRPIRWPWQKKKPTVPKKSYGFKSHSYSQCANNIQKSLDRMRKRPRRYYDFNVNSRVFHSQNYRMSLFNKNTLGLDNHFQGIAKLKGSNNFIISGGDFKRKEAHLFVINRGRVVKKMIIGKGNLWHPGGISVAGDVLAVPNQAYKTSGPDYIQFYDVRDPKNPKELFKIQMTIGMGISFHRRRSDQRYILIHGSKVSISKTANILDKFKPSRPLNFSAKQNQSIIEDCRTKELYVVNFNNDSKAAPILPGKDIASLYKLNLNEGGASASGTKIKDYIFNCGYMRCNFAAAATLYIERNRIKIRATHHYRRWFGKKIRSGEFY